MDSVYVLAMASLLGLGTTSSSLLGVSIGLYVPFSKRPLAFAAGCLISAQGRSCSNDKIAGAFDNKDRWFCSEG